MKKLLGKLSLFIPIIVLVVLTNYFVDPAYLFKNKGYLPGIADLLLSGQNVGNVSNFDERLLQKYYISHLEKRKDVVVLGSSRGMQIGREVFPKRDFFNNSVSGATIEDFMAIYNMYDQKRMLPKLIVLSVDPWIFNKHNGESRWESISDNFYIALKKQKIPNLAYGKKKVFVSEKELQLVSFSYFQNSLERLFLIWRGKLSPQYIPTLQREAQNAILLSDGSRSVAREERLRTEQQVFNLAQLSVSEKPIYHLGSFEKMDAYIIEEFESFIHLIKSMDTEIMIFLPPYNPFVYDYFVQSDQYVVIRDVENYLKKFAEKEKVRIVGSYDPHPYALTQNDFYDGMHAKRSAIKKLFQNSY